MKLTPIYRRFDMHERLNLWYGVAYLDPYRRQAVCFVVPLHLYVRFGRWLWRGILYGGVRR